MDEFRSRLLTDRLSLHKVVGIDSSIFIYQLEAHPVYQSLANIVLTGVIEQRYEGITSIITMIELTVHPWRAKMEIIAREYETLLVHFPNLQLIEINRNVARRAARLRAQFGIHIPDALQVSAALENGSTAFVTNDVALQRLRGLMDVITLREFVRG
jgi:predicted nucleic acid-binding protein